VWAWLEPVGRVLWELRWALLLYFGGLFLCYKIIDSIWYWIAEWRREKAEARFREADLAAVDQMSAQEFLQYLAYLFRSAGFTVQLTPPVGNYGVDLVLTHPTTEQKIAVRAHRTDEPVEPTSVVTVEASRLLYGCERAMVVTSGEFTEEARQQGEAAGVILVDRTRLQEMMVLTSAPQTALFGISGRQDLTV
jgi:restriction system protein